METETLASKTKSNISQRIIALGVVVGFCYWASSVLMTLLLSVLIAYFLDPFVEALESWRIPRALGSLLIVLLVIALVFSLGYLMYDRGQHFMADWPRYSAVLRGWTDAVQSKLEEFEKRYSQIQPAESEPETLQVQVAGDHSLKGILRSMLGSLYSVLFVVTFVPFLVFFMLAAKQDVWHGTLQLFPPTQRTRVKEILEQVGEVLRGFMLGNAVVAGILALVSWMFFWMLGLDNPLLAGVTSGVLNLVPYIGAVLAWVPPFIVGLGKWQTIGPFVGIAALLSIFHLVAINVLMPALVGKRVHLNALAVTLALLFWGWMWGGLGLILAIPITATIKVICDNVESWQPLGRWLGS